VIEGAETVPAGTVFIAPEVFIVPVASGKLSVREVLLFGLEIVKTPEPF
jgi:hypothetical protein